MGTLTRFLSVALFIFSGAEAFGAGYSASAHGFNITIEPIVGYEYTQRDTPTVHRKGMLIYGARFTAGRPHIAAEGEYTRGSDSEAFVTPTAMTVNTTRENVRLGVRGTYDVASRLGVFLRLGGQASKASVTQMTLSSTTTTADPKWLLKPYAGTGLNIALANLLSIGLEASYVFNSVEDFSKNTIQLAGSIRINLNAK